MKKYFASIILVFVFVGCLGPAMSPDDLFKPSDPNFSPNGWLVGPDGRAISPAMIVVQHESEGDPSMSTIWSFFPDGSRMGIKFSPSQIDGKPIYSTDKATAQSIRKVIEELNKPRE